MDLFRACRSSSGASSEGSVYSVEEIGFTFDCESPFLFAVYHLDRYPIGNERLGPNASLAGRSTSDFGKEWNMYHGVSYGVPGFPRHPHRGFETITITRHGFVDHADSLGNEGRFGNGDVQWMSAAKGVCHAEMFPLLNRDKENLLELFQIWLNLPNKFKMGDPGYAMLWSEDLPRGARDGRDESAALRLVTVGSLALASDLVVTVIAGQISGLAEPPPAPPGSLGADPQHGLMVLTLQLPPGGAWTLPAYSGSGGLQGLHRNIYFFSGPGASVDGASLKGRKKVKVRPDRDVRITADASGPADFLILQGRDLNEPVVQGGPYVAASRDELMQAEKDFRKTGFGGWRFDTDAPVQPRDAPRFMRYTDGRVEERPR